MGKKGHRNDIERKELNGRRRKCARPNLAFFWTIRSTNCKEIYSQSQRVCINQYQVKHKRRQFMSLLDVRVSDILHSYVANPFSLACTSRQWIFFRIDDTHAHPNEKRKREKRVDNGSKDKLRCTHRAKRKESQERTIGIIQSGTMFPKIST